MSAIVAVDHGHAASEMTLNDLLGAYAHDPDAFEELGALKVGETITVDEGQTTVRRLS